MIKYSVFFVFLFLFFSCSNNEETNLLKEEHSIKTNSESPYALTKEINDPKLEEAFTATVWKKGVGSLIASSDNGFYKTGNEVLEVKNGWEKIKIQFVIPPHIKANKIKIYGYNNKKNTTYFNNLLVKRVGLRELEYPEIKDENLINIILDTINFNKIRSLRKEAFEKNILQSTSDSWVKAKLIFKGDTNKIKMRLKGDWLDHLANDKWSFRIKMKTGHIMHMKEFSIQHPSTRKYMHEWLMHDFLMKEDILTTKYDFIPVKINGRSLGVYAIEEHFKNHLLENKNRREGPMLKLGEEGFWNYQLAAHKKEASFSYPYPIFNASIIKPFSKKKTLKDSLQKLYFIKAQNNLAKYKNFNTSISEVFDVVKYAKYFALTDIFKGYHGLAWHNQRFYFNPLTEKIEPIVYDANKEGANTFTSPNRFVMAQNTNEFKEIETNEHYFVFQAFNDPLFRKEYFKQLDYYVNKYNWKEYFEKADDAKSHRKNLLKNEFPTYDFSFDFLTERIKNIKDSLPKLTYDSSLIKNWFINLNSKDYLKEHPSKLKKSPDLSEKPIKDVSLVAYKESKEQDKKVYTFINFHHKDIEIIGTGKNEKTIEKIKALSIKAFNLIDLSSKKVYKSLKKIKYISYRVKGTKEEYIVKVIKWASPKTAKTKKVVTDFSFFSSQKGNTLILNSGKYNLNKSLVIPKGKIVNIKNGAQITLMNGASIISFSPLKINGCTITAQNGGGISIINVKEKSIITNTQFNNLTPNNYLQTCTGGVSIYNSNIEFDKCTFNNIMAEDGLNLVSCNYTISNCTFNNCMSDGFDIDYGKGKLTGVTINNAGNDGLDLSYTDINITDININNPKDKGISIGEATTLKGNNVFIKSGYIGLAVKDGSNAELNKLSILESKIGLVMMIKKDFFDSPSLTISKSNIEGIEKNYVIDERAVFINDRKKIKSTGKINSKKFY